MKYLSFISLTLISSLLLTGCASSLSLEDQTKLIEYEMCVKTELEKWLLKGKNGNWTQISIEQIEELLERDSKVLADYFIRDCERFRP